MVAKDAILSDSLQSSGFFEGKKAQVTLGTIQPHGALLVVHAETRQIVQASANTQAFLGQEALSLINQPLNSVLEDTVIHDMLEHLGADTNGGQQYQCCLAALCDAGPLVLFAHHVPQHLILEFERLQGEEIVDSPTKRNMLFALENADSLAELVNVAVKAVRDLTGFDRVMLYRFLPDNCGEVIAESRNSKFESYLGYRFPESDIPEEARAMYMRCMLRQTVNAKAEPVPLVPKDVYYLGRPISLEGAMLRCTVPHHLKYLQNMGITSNLSISIVVGGRLWGLVTCHHREEYVVPPATRTHLEYLGRLLNLLVRQKNRLDTDRFREQLRVRQVRLLRAAAVTTNPLEALKQPALELPKLMRSGGVIIYFDGQWQTLGDVPSGSFASKLLAWLASQVSGVVWHTDSLAKEWPEAQKYSDLASGVLAVSVGTGWQECVIWLRPQSKTMVTWSGSVARKHSPHPSEDSKVHTYVEHVLDHSEPWHLGEIEEADVLQKALTVSLGERLSVMRNMNAELEQSNKDWKRFAFVIAHDMQEPVRLITQFSDLFRQRYRDKLDRRGERVLQTIFQEAKRIRSLVDDLYTYTELLSIAQIERLPVNLTGVLAESLKDLQGEIDSTGAKIRLSDSLPTVQGDRARLQELMTHLISNAIIFHDEKEPIVEVGAHAHQRGWDITFKDNGVGIDPHYHELIFELFQRLGPRPLNGGNGIGLSLCQRIAHAHGGNITIKSKIGEGSTFTLFLPGGSEVSDTDSSWIIE